MKRITQRLLSSVALGLMVVVAGLLGPAPAGATESALDQSQPAQNTSGQIGSGGGTGEVFTAGQSGYLTRVSLYLGQYAPGITDVLNVNIQTVTSEGLPSGTGIGHGWISFDKIPESEGWVDVDIDGAFVTAGTQYALLLSTGSNIVLWYMEIGDVKPYPSGYWVSQAGGTWQKILTNQDWAFKTYVAPDTLDQNQSQTSGTGGGTRALGTTPVGQTFTVGSYGLLDRIKVYLTNASSTPAPITVTILKVGSNGLPVSGTQVATATIPAAAIPQPYARSWASAGFDPLLVKPGERYAILLSTAGSGVQWVLVSDVYSSGTVVIRNGTSWATTSSDFAFQTYVLEPVLDQSQTHYNFPFDFGQFGPAAQTFTPHMTGTLSRISVVVSYSTWLVATGDVGVAIALTDLDPTWRRPSVNIGSGTIPLGAVTPAASPGWINVDITGASVIAGNMYAIVLEEPGGGMLDWHSSTASVSGDTYPEGYALAYSNVPYSSGWNWFLNYDMAFKTYVLPVPTITTAPGPGGGAIMPCSGGVCPAASGGFTPANLTEGVTSHFQFRERPNGTVQGILNFNDSRPDGIVLRGCTTESAACTLTVTTFACTGTQSMRIGGTYTPRGEAATRYRLTLSESPGGPGTFSLTAGDYNYTMTLNGIVKVTCPPPRTVGGP